MKARPHRAVLCPITRQTSLRLWEDRAPLPAARRLPRRPPVCQRRAGAPPPRPRPDASAQPPSPWGLPVNEKKCAEALPRGHPRALPTRHAANKSSPACEVLRGGEVGDETGDLVALRGPRREASGHNPAGGEVTFLDIKPRRGWELDHVMKRTKWTVGQDDLLLPRLRIFVSRPLRGRAEHDED